MLLVTAALKAQTFNILDYGAKPGQKSTMAIQKAVNACHEAGGGTVVVPAGKFITGTIELKSYVHLQLQQGSILEGSLDLSDYSESFRRNGIFYCYDAEEVSVTGPGVIHARGKEFLDTTKNHVYDEFDKSVVRQGEDYMPAGQFYSDGPLKKLPKPGQTMTFYHCSNITLKDFTIKDTPSWAIRIAYSDGIHISGLSIYNNLMAPNSDGIHFTTSRNAVVSDCDIRAGDDAIIVTGFSLDEETPGYDLKAQNLRTYGNKTAYAENISVTNCQLQSRSAGIRIGYGQHPIRRCTFNNINIYESNRGIGVFAHDASDIEDLVFSNFTIQTRLHNGQWWGNGEPIHLSAISRFSGEPAGTIRRVQFNNILATSEHGILVYGQESSVLENISFTNIDLKIVSGRETLAYGGNFDLRPASPITKQLFEHDIPAIYAQYVDNLRFNGISVSWGDDLPQFFTYALECDYVKSLQTQQLSGTANPSSGLENPFRLKDTHYLNPEP